MLTDTHCHLYYDELYNDLSQVIQRANNLGVTRFICVGTNIEDSKKCLSISEDNNNIFASAGVHPHDSKNVSESYIDDIYKIIDNKNMIAIGEIGLDYFRNFSDPEIQKQVFREQMEIAQDINSPVIIHNRDSDKDLINILKDYPTVKGIAHCFSSDLEMARSLLEIGYYISFSGNLTFKNSHLPEVAKSIPLNRVLVETDSPYLSPEPHRGKSNEPGRTRFVVEKLSEIYKMSFESIAKQTNDNATEIFGLP